jgi:anaerobic ribonucleoside-triphosphate reductase activating protein
MNYHDIKHDDMNNGDGLRVTLFVSGCTHHCTECQNRETWEIDSGIPFDNEAKKEIFDQLSKDYISGLTLSGGDPLHSKNVTYIHSFLKEVKEKFPDKTIWIYTGYTWENIFNITSTEDSRMMVVSNYCDVLVDGMFKSAMADVNYHWAGSTNQRVIDVKQSLKEGEVVLYV